VGADTGTRLVGRRQDASSGSHWTYLAVVTTCFSESSTLSINGKNALATRYGPLTLTSQTFHQVSGSLSLIIVISRTPALLTSTSSLPTDFSTSAAASATEAGFVTSSLIFKICGFGRPASWAAFWTAVSVASRLERAPRTIVEAPALAKLIAIERPMPLLAPLMKTAFPERSCLVGSMAG
jgi:hypothetical protein